jgi:hypothetical protein
MVWAIKRAAGALVQKALSQIVPGAVHTIFRHEVSCPIMNFKNARRWLTSEEQSRQIQTATNIFLPMNNGYNSNARGEHDAFIWRMLGDRRKKEALAWLKGRTPGDERLIGGCHTNRESILFVKKLYGIGAKEVIAVQIRSARKPRKCKRTGKLVVAFPESPDKRKDLLDWCKAQGESLGYSPEFDHGESHLFLLLD